MRNTFHRSLKPLGLFLLIAMAIVWMAFDVGCGFEVKHETLKKGQDMPKQSGKSVIQTPIVDEEGAEPMCPISGPKGPWDYYQMGDLPRGDCSRTQACTVWTKDSCARA